MNILDLFRISSPIEDYEIDYNGNVINTDATIKDPSLKFTKPKYIKRFQTQNKILRNIVFVDSEYDLSTVANAVQLDGLLNRSVNIFVEQIIKNGYEVVIPNQKLYQHVSNRLKEIELFTNIKNTELTTLIARQLVTYGNAYVIKVRKTNVSKYGKKYKLYNRTVQPIVGLFMADATTMKIGLDVNNKIKYYKQMINGVEKIFNVDDVIHLTYNKIPGLLTGRTPIISVLDDVRALRKLEEEAEILGFQYAVPLYLYKVGTDQHPAAPGEVDAVAMEINTMNTYGIMTVPHTHTIETVTNNNDPIDIMKYIEHFKKRIYSGIGLSAAVMGETDTSNRNTSEAAYLSMQAITKSYQQIIKEKLEMELLKELVMDAGYDPSRFQFELKFKEIDLEATIKKETHVLQKYQGNLITLTEARMELEMETKIDYNDLYLNKIQIPLAQAEAESQIPVVEKQGDVKIKVEQALSKLIPSGSSKSSSTNTTPKKTTTKKSKTAASEKSTTTKSQPTNQYGKQLSRPTFKRDFENNIEYAKQLSNSLLNNDNYKSPVNRSTFLNKLKLNIKDTILQLDIDLNDIEYIMKIFEIRITDRLNRLSNVDSDEKFDFIIQSIYDEINNISQVVEINDEE